MVSEKQPLLVGGVPEHFNLPWHLAIESGAFQRHGLSVEYRDVHGGTGAMARRLRDDELDVAIVLAEGGVAALEQGNPSRIVKVYVDSPLIWGIHVAGNSSIEQVADIQSQRYAVSRFGSGSHLMAIVDASLRKWPIDSMQFEKVDNLTGARQALADGAADVFFWERFTTAPYVQSGEFRRIGERRTLWPAFVVCVREKILADRAGDVRVMLDVVNEFCGQLMADQNACELISQRYDLQLSDVRQWFAQTKWSTDFEKPTAAIELIKDYLKKIGVLDERPANERNGSNGHSDSDDLWFQLPESTNGQSPGS